MFTCDRIRGHTKTMLLLSFYLINFFSWKLLLFFHVRGCSGMFRHVPECSMFLVLSTPVWKATQAWLGGKSCLAHINPSNFQQPLQPLLLRYTAENLQVTRIELLLTNLSKSELFWCLQKLMTWLTIAKGLLETYGRKKIWLWRSVHGTHARPFEHPHFKLLWHLFIQNR